VCYVLHLCHCYTRIYAGGWWCSSPYATGTKYRCYVSSSCTGMQTGHCTHVVDDAIITSCHADNMPIHDSAGTYNSAAAVVCSAGDAHCGTTCYMAPVTTTGATCLGYTGGVYTATSGKCVIDASYSCAAGSTLSGTTCYTPQFSSWTCPTSYLYINPTNCQYYYSATPVDVCPTGYTADSSQNDCYETYPATRECNAMLAQCQLRCRIPTSVCMRHT
jgi:hypothetical protein